MPLLQFTVALDKHVFYSGEEIRGIVYMLVRDAIEASCLKLLLSGEISWELYTSSNNSNRPLCGGNQVLLREDLTLFGKAGGSLRVIPGGMYEYPFQILLPIDLPSSFEGDHGYLRYVLKAILEKTNTMSKVKRVKINVVQYVDTNKISYLLRPCFARETEVGIACFPTGTVSLVCSLDRGAYVSGDFMMIFLLCHNRTPWEIRRLAISLIRRVIYRVEKTKKQIQDETLLAHKGGLSVERKMKKEWKRLFIRVPMTTPTIRTPILEVKYAIVLVIEMPHQKPLKVELPFVVGTAGPKDVSVKKKELLQSPVLNGNSCKLTIL